MDLLARRVRQAFRGGHQAWAQGTYWPFQTAVALHLAPLARGIGPGNEVLVPNLTFAATINTVIQAGATPVIVDGDPQFGNMDPAAAAAAINGRTKAICRYTSTASRP